MGARRKLREKSLFSEIFGSWVKTGSPEVEECRAVVVMSESFGLF